MLTLRRGVPAQGCLVNSVIALPSMALFLKLCQAMHTSRYMVCDEFKYLVAAGLRAADTDTSAPNAGKHCQKKQPIAP